MTIAKNKKNCQRRGSTYLLTLSVALVLAVIGFTALTSLRINSRQVTNANDWTEAGILAFSSVEYAVQMVNKMPMWRTTIGSGTTVPSLEKTFGGGQFGAVFVDKDDGDLADDPSDPIRLYGIGRVGGAVRVHSVLIQPNTGLDVLRMAIHAGVAFENKSGKELMLTGAPASSGGNAKNDGVIYGDVEALTTSGSGTTTGTTTLRTAAKAMPSTSVCDRYINIATQISYSGNISGRVLGPGCNPWGATNADGVYYIDTMGQDLQIQASRIYGTLVVRTGGKTLSLVDAVLLHRYRRDYPALIVDGNLDIRSKSEAYGLSEATWSTNFNPPALPYEGVSNTTMGDTFPNEIQGLVYVTGSLRAIESPRVRGVVLCAGSITCENVLQVIYDSSIYKNPPLGFTSAASPMGIVAGSWRPRTGQ